ncbi:MAG: aminotransferase class IV, partial [Candidatus Eisenbacteria bacterium]
PATLHDAVTAVLAAEGLRDAVVRITVTRGIAGGRPVRTGAWVEAEALGGRLWVGTRTRHADGGPAGARVMVSQTPFAAGWIARHKTTSRLAWDLAREEARAAGVDEALLVNRAGEILEGAASNLFVVLPGGEVVTPPLSADVLPGVTRALVLESCARLGIPAREGPVTLESLRFADEVFLTNSVQEVLPVAMMGGRAVPARATTLRLLADYRELVAATTRV